MAAASVVGIPSRHQSSRARKDAVAPSCTVSLVCGSVRTRLRTHSQCRSPSAAPLFKLRVQRHLLRQRMLEGVLGDRIKRLLEDEVAILQNAQRQAKFCFGKWRMADLIEDTS